MKNFIELVREMRNAQKEYFKTRDKSVLLKSKELECKVDSFFGSASDKPTNNTILMNEVSIIINGVRYDAVDDINTFDYHNCDLYDKDGGCRPCVIGMYACGRLTGFNGIFKQSDKKFEK